MSARTGSTYLHQISQNGPEVWLGGEKVPDSTVHPATAAAAHQIARLYDLQHQPDNAGFALFASPSTGDPVSTQFLVPRSHDDLVKRRRMHKLWADATLGLMGRTTDFMGSMLTAWYINADFFGGRADAVRTYFEEVREHDLFLTHALIDPPVDRSKPASEQPDPFTYLGVVDETSEGIIVRGAKMLATASPYADEILVWPFSVRQPTEAENRYAIAFAIPTSTPGLRFIAREPYGLGNNFDNPLSSRFDEMDAIVVFDDVLVPWARVFINQDHQQVNNIWKVNSNAFTGHQTSVRLLSKLQFVAGLANRASGMVGKSQEATVRDLIGEITVYIELTRAAIIAAESTAEADANGILAPNVRPLFAIRNSGNRWYPRVREILQIILSGGLLYHPANLTAFDSPIGSDVAKYFRTATVSAEQRIKLYKVAADLAVSGFSGRHELYERFYAGDPAFLRVLTQFVQYDWTEPLDLVDRFLDSYDAAGVLNGSAAAGNGNTARPERQPV
jgi:4-hydroxyphenylacetate 3-monooxygenase